MKKKVLIIAGVVLSLGIVAVIIYNIYIKVFYNVPSEEVANKVVFEGLSDNIAVGESYDSVAQKINDTQKNANPKLVITIKNEGQYGLDRTQFPDNLTSEEVDALIKEHRRLLREQQQQRSGDVSKELGLDYMNITYTSSLYTPIIRAEFKGPLTQRDIADIYKIAGNSNVIKVVVQLSE